MTMTDSTIKTAFKILLALVIAGLIVNEIGSLMWANYQSGEIAKTIGDGAAIQYRASHSRTSAGQTAVRLGLERGVTVYGFDVQENNQVTVWVTVPPKRTPLVMALELLGRRWDVARGWYTKLTASLSVNAKYTTSR